MSLPIRLALLAALVALLSLGYVLRGSINIDANTESIRRFVAALGWWGPIAFVGLFALRGALLIPSVALLVAGGVCFGLLGGTLLGALGLTFSATLKFYLAALAGREWLVARLPEHTRVRLAAINDRGGAGVLGLATAYPIGPAELLHVAAILSGMRAAPFFVAIAIGALVRAASLSFFGDAMAEGEGLVLAGVMLGAAAALPLLVPRFRRMLRGTSETVKLSNSN